MGRRARACCVSPPCVPRASAIKASPLARRIARERGLDIAALTGTGPEGRIIAEDVEQAASRRSALLLLAASGDAGEVEIIELTSIRRTIARRLTEAWAAPVFQLSVTADASELSSPRASAWSSSCAKARPSRR